MGSSPPSSIRPFCTHAAASPGPLKPKGSSVKSTRGENAHPGGESQQQSRQQ